MEPSNFATNIRGHFFLLFLLFLHNYAGMLVDKTRGGKGAKRENDDLSS